MKAYLLLLQERNIEVSVLLQTVENNTLKLYVNSSMNSKILQVYNDTSLEVFEYGA